MVRTVHAERLGMHQPTCEPATGIPHAVTGKKIVSLHVPQTNAEDNCEEEAG